MKNRRGGIYLLTLAAAIVLVAVVLGLSQLLLQFRRASRLDSRAEQAHFHAQMAIRHALYFTTQSPNWRTLLPNGPWLSNITFDQATYNVRGLAPGGLGGGPEQRITLTATATVAGLARSLQVQAQQPPSLLLANAVTAAGTLSIANKAQITGPISSNTAIDKSGADTYVFGPARAVGPINSTANISGPILPGSPAQAFPDNNDIISYYTSSGPALPYLPLLESTLISPSRNPLALLNPDGVFVINCLNQKITLRNLRVVGTLVLLNPKSDSTIDQSVSLRPARPDFPALIVQGGGLTINTANDLSEAALHQDFSLPGEPGFPTQTDTYPNAIQGAVYVNGSLTLAGNVKITGSVIVTGPCSVKDNATVTLDPTLAATNAPRAIRDFWLAPLRGSWQEP